MEEYLIKRYYLYPKMQIEDFIKMLYEAEFGNAHVMLDTEECLSRLEAELNDPKMKHRIKEALYDDISDNYVAINLRVYKKKKFDVEALNNALINTSIHNYGTIIGFTKKVDTLKRLIQKNIIPLDISSLDYLDKYCENILPIHHSYTYHKHYKPSYRVIEREELKKILSLEK